MTERELIAIMAASIYSAALGRWHDPTSPVRDAVTLLRQVDTVLADEASRENEEDPCSG